MRQNKKRLGLLITITCLALAVVILSPLLLGAGDQIHPEVGLQRPGMGHIFGTDNLGRDLFSRSMIGLRLSLALALVIQILSLATGMLLGLISGYYGGLADKIFVVIQNVLLSFPSLIATLCMILLLGSGMRTLVLALAFVNWVGYARLIRSEVMVTAKADFIQGAKAVGTSDLGLFIHHIVPNVIRPVVPLFTLMIGHTVLAISGLGFLGFGVQPPTAEIGLMVRDGITYINKAPWMFFLPGMLLALYSLLFNMLGDELQDIFSPRDISANA